MLWGTGAGNGNLLPEQAVYSRPPGSKGHIFRPERALESAPPPWVSNLDRRLRTLIQSSPLVASETRKSYAEWEQKPLHGYMGRKRAPCKTLSRQGQKEKERASAACTPRRRSDGASSSGTRSSLRILFAPVLLVWMLFTEIVTAGKNMWIFFSFKIYFWKVCYVGNWFVFRESFADVLVFSQ